MKVPHHQTCRNRQGDPLGLVQICALHISMMCINDAATVIIPRECDEILITDTLTHVSLLSTGYTIANNLHKHTVFTGGSKLVGQLCA